MSVRQAKTNYSFDLGFDFRVKSSKFVCKKGKRICKGKVIMRSLDNFYFPLA